MPIVAEHSEPKRQRAFWWVAVLSVIALPLLGLFAWSWREQVTIEIGPQKLSFGIARMMMTPPHLLPQPKNGWVWGVALPGTRYDGYVIRWTHHPK